MIMSMILARSVDDVIGIGDKLPWRCPAELAHFKKITAGPNKAVVMGRKTWESLPAEHRPLKDRLNIILTRNPKDIQDNWVGALAAGNIDAAITAAKFFKIEELFFIGGKDVYTQVLDRVDVVHLSEMNVMVGDDKPDLVLFDHHFASSVHDDQQEWRIETEYPVYEGGTGKQLFDYTKLVRL